MATAPSRDTDETSVVVTAPSSEEESSLERTTALPLTEMPTAAQEDIEFEPAPVSHKIIMAFAVVLPFIGCIAAIVHLWQYGLVNWLYIGMLVGGWVLTGMGITIGFHRMLTHRSFETIGLIRGFWMAMGTLAVEGSPLVWCAVHRKHHQCSDHEGDPHSPHLHGKGWWRGVKGFVHAHTGWLFTGFWCKIDLKRYVPDLVDDDLLRLVDRYYYLCVAMSLAIPAVLGGLITMTWYGALLGFIWGGLARIFVTHHVTWSINSICHIFGGREFKSGDDSRNNLIFGIFAHGEGWHNNHHAFPTSARHGLRWWQFDSSWIVIRTMQLVGLAWDVRLPSKEAMLKKRHNAQSTAITEE